MSRSLEGPQPRLTGIGHADNVFLTVAFHYNERRHPLVEHSGNQALPLLSVILL